MSTSASNGSRSGMAGLRCESMFRENAGEALARAEEHDLHRLRLDADGRADFLMRGAFDVREPEERALLRLELGERAHHVVPQVVVSGGRRRVRNALAIALHFAVMIEHEIRGCFEHVVS